MRSRQPKLTFSGPTNYHIDDQERGDTREVRSQQRRINLHWRGSAWKRNGRGPKPHFPFMGYSSGLRYVLLLYLLPQLTLEGLTETCTVATSTSPTDIFLGSSGSIFPGIECRIVTPEGKEVTDYDTPGELWVKSPSVVLGYLNNEKATKETFVDGFMKTGDEALVRKSPKGYEHVFIVDRIKELIKVKVRKHALLWLCQHANTSVTGSPGCPGRTRSPSPHPSLCE